MTGFALPEEIAQLGEAALRFAERELSPQARGAERAGRWSADVLRVLDEFRLRGLDVPGRLGGAGIGSLAKVVTLEALAVGDAGGLPAADQPGPAAEALAACPDAYGVAPVAAACLAGRAQCALVVVDAEADGHARVEWAPAWPPLRWVFVSRGDSLRLLEITGELAPTRALAFQASGGVSTSLAGCRELGRFELDPAEAFAVRGRARLWAAAVAVGVAQSALDATLRYTTERVVFGKPVAHHQGNAFELAVAATHLHGSRLVVRDAAERFDRGDPQAGFWATQAFLTAIDAAISITDQGIQLLGGHGFLVDHLAEKRFREARMLGLLAGGRDAAEADLAENILSVPDPIFAPQARR